MKIPEIELPNIKARLERNSFRDSNTNCLNWLGETVDGYGLVTFLGKKRKTHRLIAAMYLDFDIESELQVLHSCDNRRCINQDHIFIGTHKDNHEDKVKKNRQYRPTGSKNPFSKLNETKVLEIRKLFTEGTTRKELAEKFNISLISIYQIISRRRWRNI